MPFPIRPGKITCAGLVAIMMVLPTAIWKGNAARTRLRTTTSSRPDIPESDEPNAREKARD